MFTEREKFIASILRITDFLTLLLVFPVAYFVDEIVRITANLSVKAYAIGPTVEGFVLFTSKYWTIFVGFPFIWIGLFYLNGIYRSYRTRSFRKLIWLVFMSGFWATIASGSYLFLLRIEMASRLFFIVFSCCALYMIILEKRIVLKILDTIHKKGYNQENLLIVGTGKRAKEFIGALKQNSSSGL